MAGAECNNEAVSLSLKYIYVGLLFIKCDATDRPVTVCDGQ